MATQMQQNPYLPPEYEQRLGEFTQRKLLAQAILASLQKGQGTEMLGGVAVRKSPVSGVVDALTATLAQRQAQEAGAGELGVRQDFENAEGQMMQRMQNLPTLEQQIEYGNSSNSPRAQALAKALLAQRGQMQNTWLGKVAESDPQAAAGVARTGEVPANFQPSPAAPPVFGEHRLSNGTALPTVVTTKRNGEQTGSFGSLPSTTNIDTVGEKEAMKAAGKDVPDLFKSAQAKVELGADMQKRAETLTQLANDPALIAGAGGNIQLFFSNLGAKLGFNTAEAATKTQALIRGLAQTVLDNSKEMKGALSDKDIKFLEQITSGSIELTPETLRDATNLMQAAGFNMVQRGLQQYVGVRDASPDGTNARIAKQYPLVPFSTRAPQGKGFTLQDTGTFQTSIYNPATANTPPAKPLPKLDPKRVYTPQELRDLGVKF